MIKPISPIFLLSCLFPTATLFAQSYELSFRNITNQALTSPVCAIHSKKTSLFSAGDEASAGLKVLAEDGVSETFRNELNLNRNVRTTAVGSFIAEKKRSKLQITSRKRGRLSCVFGMLVATNDGFPADLNIRLPRKVGQSSRLRAMVYDAGTEMNTESCEHVPGGPCDAHFVGLSEGGTIQPHQGIVGNADLDAQRFGWRKFAVKGKVTRVK